MPVENVEGFENCICHHPDLVNLYDCSIFPRTKIGAFVEIGRNVVVGYACKIQSGAYIPEGVSLGNHVFIGPNVTFCNSKYPMQGDLFQETIVGNNVVIGAGSTILPGIAIGDNAIIGAGSVVTGNVPPGATAYGNPARVIANEDREIDELVDHLPTRAELESAKCKR